ncbi:MAG: 6-bladed beta-propeller [Candidatus Marinimicrobia bacterium]|nr:6-bladed beta-propeller [Candidatus Neomarinimicrobiota bacterium]
MTKNYFQMIIPLVLIIMTSCAHRQADLKPLTFPADMDQPFLSLTNIVGEEVKTSDSFIGGLALKVKGPQQLISMARPTAVAIYGENILFVVDADAGEILKLQYEQGQLKTVMSFGDEWLSAPLGIAIWDDIIYISDSQTGQIHRFSLDLEYLNSLTIQDLQRPGQLKLNTIRNELLVVDTKAHQILAVNAEGDVKATIQNAGKRKAVLNGPLALDIAPDGKLVVLDALTRRVEFYSQDYAYVGGFGGYDHVPGSFSNPRGLAVSSDGYIFVSDAAFGNIQIFDSQGALLYFFGKNGTGRGEFLMPGALYFDSLNNLYVIDQYNNRIQVFNYAVQGG